MLPPALAVLGGGGEGPARACSKGRVVLEQLPRGCWAQEQRAVCWGPIHHSPKAERRDATLPAVLPLKRRNVPLGSDLIGSSGPAVLTLTSKGLGGVCGCDGSIFPQEGELGGGGSPALCGWLTSQAKAMLVIPVQQSWGRAGVCAVPARMIFRCDQGEAAAAAQKPLTKGWQRGGRAEAQGGCCLSAPPGASPASLWCLLPLLAFAGR